MCISGNISADARLAACVLLTCIAPECMVVHVVSRYNVNMFFDKAILILFLFFVKTCIVI